MKLNKIQSIVITNTKNNIKTNGIFKVFIRKWYFGGLFMRMVETISKRKLKMDFIFLALLIYILCLCIYSYIGWGSIKFVVVISTVLYEIIHILLFRFFWR